MEKTAKVAIAVLLILVLVPQAYKVMTESAGWVLDAWHESAASREKVQKREAEIFKETYKNLSYETPRFLGVRVEEWPNFVSFSGSSRQRLLSILTAWQKAHPTRTVRAVLPITEDGNTIAVVVWLENRD